MDAKHRQTCGVMRTTKACGPGTPGLVPSLAGSRRRPYRARRAEFRKAKEEDLATETEEFWFNIPGNLFIVMASDIANLNLRYISRKPLSFRPSEEEREVLLRLLDRLKDGK